MKHHDTKITMRIINLLSGINGVVAGGNATLSIPVGRRYHALKVFLAATVGGRAGA